MQLVEEQLYSIYTNVRDHGIKSECKDRVSNQISVPDKH